MEFAEKLLSLRKQRNMTQEQLAELLYVSRTAVSKWESGRGYPNIDSLKALSEVFSVSVDELLSGSEIITAVEEESKDKAQKVVGYVFGIFDALIFFLAFLPLYGERLDSGYIVSVTLANHISSAFPVKFCLFSAYILFFLLGIFELFTGFFTESILPTKTVLYASLFLNTLMVFFLIMTNEPYASFFLFTFLIAKVLAYAKFFLHQSKRK